MFTKLNSAYVKFKNNINKAIEPIDSHVVTIVAVLVVTMTLVGIVATLAVLIALLLHWPVITFSTIMLVTLARVLYAGYTGR